MVLGLGLVPPPPLLRQLLLLQELLLLPLPLLLLMLQVFDALQRKVDLLGRKVPGVLRLRRAPILRLSLCDLQRTASKS